LPTPLNPRKYCHKEHKEHKGLKENKGFPFVFFFKLDEFVAQTPDE